MARENDRFLKQIAFHLLRLAVYRNDSVRKRAVIGLQILVKVRHLDSCIDSLFLAIRYELNCFVLAELAILYADC